MKPNDHELLTQELCRHEAYLAEAQRLSHTGSFGWKPATGEIVWYLRSTLAYDDAWRHGIAGCDAGHHRPVRNAKIVESIDLEVVVHYRHRIATHLGGAGLVVIGSGRP